MNHRDLSPTVCSVKASFCFHAGFIVSQNDLSSGECDPAHSFSGRASTRLNPAEETGENISGVRRKQHQTSKNSQFPHSGLSIPGKRWIKSMTVFVFAMIVTHNWTKHGRAHSAAATMWICSPAFLAMVSVCTVSITGWLRTLPAAWRKG